MEYQRQIFTFFICILWRICIATASDPDRCSKDLCTAPSDASNSSGLYDLRLSSQVYSTTGLNNTKIYVQVAYASCPTFQTPGPKYYRLEAYSDGKGYYEHAGLFDEPIHRIFKDTERCAANEIVFSICEPTMTDLPRTYGWNAPGVYQGDICFRLSIVTDGQEDSCEQVTKCIVPDFQYMPNPSEGPKDESEMTEITSVVVTSPEKSHEKLRTDMEKCYNNRNCTNPNKLLDLCGSDGRIYPSRCHAKLEDCLTNAEFTFKKYKGNCSRTQDLPPPPTNQSLLTTTAEPRTYQFCYQRRATNGNSPSGSNTGWIYRCDCDGNFKRVQCDTSSNDCWCSTKSGGQDNDKRWVFSCDRLRHFVECHRAFLKIAQ